MSATTTAPLNGVVYITARIGSEQLQASGVLIAPNLVLTASHVVWQAGIGTATTITVAPGYGSGVAPYGDAYAVSYNFNPIDDANEEVSGDAIENDYAVIKLGTSFSGPTEFALGANFTGGTAYVSGYPAAAGGALQSSAQTLSLVPSYSILEGLTLGAGSSGGPIWTSSPHGAPTVYGVVSAQNGSIAYDVQLTSSALSQIRSWVVQDEAPRPPLSVFDATTHTAVNATCSGYTGPVAWLQNSYVNITSDNLSIMATTPNWFIATGSGNDAITVTSGNNVIDGGSGSNFLIGGVGDDTFFINAHAPHQDIWSTVVQFHKGDHATLWGVSQADAPSADWFDDQGAAGYTGLTLHATTAGGTSASLTLDGYSKTDLSNGRLEVAYGVDASDRPYMVIAGTG
jgi:V8-like Glu-specific endopeptidase